LGQHGNAVRRGDVPSVMGWCLGVMAWPPPAKEPSRKSAVSRGGSKQPDAEWFASPLSSTLKQAFINPLGLASIHRPSTKAISTD